jgi:hypothetical protein
VCRSRERSEFLPLHFPVTAKRGQKQASVTGEQSGAEVLGDHLISALERV